MQIAQYKNLRKLLFSLPIQTAFFSKINAHYIPNSYTPPTFTPSNNASKGLKSNHYKEDWSLGEIQSSTEQHVVYTWGATDASRKSAMPFQRGEGPYLVDFNGKKYYDWSSQAICNNLGYSVPESVLNRINKQLRTLPMVYGGLTISEAKARIAQIMNDISPPGITGFFFPSTGSDANEAAMRVARRYTGRQKILTRYKSYHGAATGPLTATGDFRRWFAEQGVSGYVKFFDFQPNSFQWGRTEKEALHNYFAYLEEIIINENPNTIAGILVETICGSGGVLVNPPEYLQGIRALCDKYKILLILDEVMVGMCRTGEFFSFQTYQGIVPDIFTCAKGITGSFLPLSAVGLKKEIQDFFRNNALGWGSTFQAHPVSCACAYEVIKYYIDQDINGHVKKLEKVMKKRIDELISKHNCLRQGRVRGLFGCMDIVGKDGQLIKKQFQDPNTDLLNKFSAKLIENGIYMWVRAPVFHHAPPLIITEEQLNDGFDRIDDAFKVLDH